MCKGASPSASLWQLDGEERSWSQLRNGGCPNIPCALVIKESVRPLFVLLRNCLGLLMALEPSLVLFVEAPALIL